MVKLSLAEPTLCRAKYSGLHFTDFLKVLLAVCLTLTVGDNDDNFSFLFPPKFDKPFTINGQ